MWLIAIPILWIIAVCLSLGAQSAGYRKVGGWGLLILLGFPVLFLGWCTFRPDLLITPVDRFFMSEFDSRTDQPSKSLIPAIFQRGMAWAKVDQILQQDGFKPYTQAPDDVWYAKDGPFFLPCSNTFRVEAKFDASGLVDAIGDRASICL